MLTLVSHEGDGRGTFQLDQKIDEVRDQLDRKIDALRDHMDQKIDALRGEIDKKFFWIYGGIISVVVGQVALFFK